ncbi:hypothetical protein ABIA22_001763 [Sinorhizobium fredii]|uniref:phage protein Gp13 family protein n=1 Tax=Rhizobium fredii TaxID=380 RepID=UPI003519A51C
MLHYRRATVADAIDLAPRLREADKNEFRAFLGLEPEIVLPFDIVAGQGDTWALVGSEGVIGLFGVQPVDQNPLFGLVWMVTSDDLFKYRREFVKGTPQVLDMLHRKFPLLGNHIDARNTVHVRWLQRLGFVFLRTIPEFGIQRRPFHEFARLRSTECA